MVDILPLETLLRFDSIGIAAVLALGSYLIWLILQLIWFAMKGDGRDS